MLFSTPKSEIRRNSALEMEVGHLQANGYRWIIQWAMKPRG